MYVLPENRARPFNGSGHGSYPKFPVVDIDENGIARADTKLPTHCRWNDELATVNNSDTLRFHLHQPSNLTYIVVPTKKSGW